MKVKNYAKSVCLWIQSLPEKNIVKKIGLLSREIRETRYREDLLLKRAQREYLLNELVRRDETTQI